MNLPPDRAFVELQQSLAKIERGVERLASFSPADLAIATTPKEEIFARDMVRLYRYTPVVEKPLPVPVLIVYALVGRYQMIDLEAERSFVRKLLAQGLDVYMVDWGLPRRAHRWLTIDDYVNELSRRVRRRDPRAPRRRSRSTCSASARAACSRPATRRCTRSEVRNLVLTVTPLDFHGDAPQPGDGRRLHEPVGARDDAGRHRPAGRHARQRSRARWWASRS